MIFKSNYYQCNNFRAKELNIKCESYDEVFTGKVDMTIFKTVLLECDLGLSLNEISRFVRYIKKNNQGMVDY